MSTEKKQPIPTVAELDLGINTERVITLAVQFRKIGLSWPNSLANALSAHSTEQLDENPGQNKLLICTYYSFFLENIQETERILRDGPEPASDFIYDWTNDVEEQAEYFMKVRDDQLAQTETLAEDSSGVKLLAFKLQEFSREPHQLDPIISDGINSLISGTRDFRNIPWEDVQIEKNLRAFSYMRAFDDYRRFMTQIKDKLYLLDKVINEGNLQS